jgi:hypothetical protein
MSVSAAAGDVGVAKDAVLDPILVMILNITAGPESAKEFFRTQCVTGDITGDVKAALDDILGPPSDASAASRTLCRDRFNLMETIVTCEIFILLDSFDHLQVMHKMEL